MNDLLRYGIIFVLLVIIERCYFRIAEKCNIIDKPNQRSSHTSVVLRGGGIIFTIGAIVWGIWQLIIGNDISVYFSFLIGLILIAGTSFVDDIHSLSDSFRMVMQCIAMGLMLYSLGILHLEMWWMVIIALFVSVGIINVYNFMDGINGITGVYSLAVLLPLLFLNAHLVFVPQSLIVVTLLSVVVFCVFNFRPKGKAKCFAGDVGSVGIAFILLFVLGNVIFKTGDITYLLLLVVYGIDACLTIIHRIILHENLGQAHRKHVYQLMANELNIGHLKVSTFYALLQLVISLGLIYVCPNTILAHWLYLIGISTILAVAYVLFKKKYYHLHEEYLASLKK